MNLIVGDYFKSQKADIKKWANKAMALITWLWSKTIILAAIRSQHAENHLSMLAVIRAVITQWTAHYLAYHRLLELHGTLKVVVANDEEKRAEDKIVVTGDAKAKAKARKMVKLISDEPLFWHGIAR